MKNNIWTCLIPLCLLTACSTTQSLQYKGYDNFTVSGIPASPKIDVNLQLFNPNKLGVTLRNCDLTLQVNAKQLGQLSIPDKVKIKRESDFSLPVEFSTTLPQMGSILSGGLKSFLGHEDIPMDVQGAFTLQKFIFFRKTFQFTYSDTLNIKSLKGN